MDKWKDMELEKMKVGGNRKAREFFESQSDYNRSMSLLEKYNSRAAALYRDKVPAPLPLLSLSLGLHHAGLCRQARLPLLPLSLGLHHAGLAELCCLIFRRDLHWVLNSVK